MTDPRQKYREAKEGLRRAVERGTVSEADSEAILELTAAYDEQDMGVPLPSEGDHAEDTKHKEANTLKYWAVYLKRIAERMDVELTEATAEEVNDLMTAMGKGDHSNVKDSGLANNSIRNYQGVARRFYRYHNFGVDPEDIMMITGDDTHVDDRDMLSPEEIDRIRKAADHPRDLAIFDLLLYTGQRNTAIRSLRIRDVDLDEGVYYLNGDAEGLKGADETGKKRPLLGAVGSIREWLRYHPDAENPDAYLITGKPRYTNVDPEKMVSRNTLGYAMKGLKEMAEIDKPMNPHNIRHNFVTISKREYNLSDATVKWLIGHRPDSQVMETTYAHLSDEDRIKEAEIGAGIRDPDTENKSLSPEICHCGEPLPPDARACPRCGTVYAPDAQAVKQQVGEVLWDDKNEAEGKEEDAVDQLKRLLDENPGLLDGLTDQANAE
jgi:integrase